MNEVCTSIYAFRRDLLGPALRNLTTDNAQGEFYLTDVVEALAGMGHRVGCVQAPAVRDPGRQRSLAARPRRTRTAQPNEPSVAAQRRDDARPASDLHRRHRRRSGATSRSIRARCCRAPPSSATAATSGPTLGSSNCSVGNDVVLEYTVGHNADIESGAEVGPYALLGPGTSVFAGHRTGAFYTAPAD